MLLYMQTLNDLMRRRNSERLDTRLATQTELPVAWLQLNPARLARYIERAHALAHTEPRDTRFT